MSYQDLTLNERMQRASEYAVILNDDPTKTPELVIVELSNTFSLSMDEASEAYSNSKRIYATEYKNAGKSKALHYLLIVIAGLAIFVGYYMFSSEGGLGFFIIFSIFGALSVLGILIRIMTSIKESYLIRNPALKVFFKNPLVKLLQVILFFWLIAGAGALYDNTIQPGDLVEKSFILSNSPQLKISEGRSRERYFSFYFKGYETEFRYNMSDYSFAKITPDLLQLNPGDTIQAAVLKKQANDLNNTGIFSGNKHIYGVFVKGKNPVDFRKRTDEIMGRRTNLFKLISLGLLLNSLIVIYIYKNKYSII